jgi:hypothetical protein
VLVAVQRCCPKEEDREGTTKEMATGREGEKRGESKTCACEKQNERDKHRQRGHEKGSKSGGRERGGIEGGGKMRHMSDTSARKRGMRQRRKREQKERRSRERERERQ